MGVKENDAAEILVVARRATGDQGAELDSFDVAPLVGAGVNAAVERITGRLIGDEGPLPFSVIRKVIRGGADELRAWRREPDAYESGALRSLDGIDTPVLLACRYDPDGNGAVLWLEDVDAERGPWTLDRFAKVARALAGFAVPYATGAKSIPDASWLSRGWLEAWAAMAEGAIEELRTGVDDPLLQRLYPPEVLDTMTALWDARGPVFDVLRRGPRVFGHLDATPANTMVSGDRVVLLDWAFAGVAALGEDLGCLVGGSTIFAQPPVPPADLPGITAAALHAYLDGLAGGGCEADPEVVSWAFKTSAVYRYAIGPSAFMVKGIGPDGPPEDGIGIRDPDQRAMQEQMVGRPFEELIDAITDTLRYLILELGDDLLASLPAMQERSD